MLRTILFTLVFIILGGTEIHEEERKSECNDEVGNRFLKSLSRRERHWGTSRGRRSRNQVSIGEPVADCQQVVSDLNDYCQLPIQYLLMINFGQSRKEIKDLSEKWGLNLGEGSLLSDICCNTCKTWGEGLFDVTSFDSPNIDKDGNVPEGCIYVSFTGWPGFYDCGCVPPTHRCFEDALCYETEECPSKHGRHNGECDECSSEIQVLSKCYMGTSACQGNKGRISNAKHIQCVYKKCKQQQEAYAGCISEKCNLEVQEESSVGMMSDDKTLSTWNIYCAGGLVFSGLALLISLYETNGRTNKTNEKYFVLSEEI